MPSVDEVARPPERADDVVDPVAGSERHEVGRALADRLDHEHDRSLRRVAFGNRERDAFGARAEPDDDELTGLAHSATRGASTTSRCTSADSFVLEITS